MLLGTVGTAESWSTLLAAGEPWGRLRFPHHRNQAAYVESSSWVPDMEPAGDEDAWHLEDSLFAPLTSTDA